MIPFNIIQIEIVIVPNNGINVRSIECNKVLCETKQGEKPPGVGLKLSIKIPTEYEVSTFQCIITMLCEKAAITGEIRESEIIMGYDISPVLKHDQVTWLGKRECTCS